METDDPANLKALAWALPFSTLLFFLALFSLWSEGLLVAFGAGVLAFISGIVIVGGGALGLAHISAVGASRILLPRGQSMSRPDDFSLQKALLARGDLPAALRSIEDMLLRRPSDPHVCLFAADVFAGAASSPRRAASLFHVSRTLDATSAAQDLYATNRLIDLYVGPLADPGAASAELARLIERHPQSSEAVHAPRLIQELRVSIQERNPIPRP